MKKIIIIVLSLVIGTMNFAFATTKHHKVRHVRHKVHHKAVAHVAHAAQTQPIPIEQIENFDDYSPSVKSLISKAFKLSQMNLTYKFGSADPRNKGLDCSGTIYYLLNKSDMQDVPRDAESLFNWVKEEGQIHRVSGNNLDDSEFLKLKPGDLLFWSGTYATHRSISHVMMYLGKNKQGKPLMFGSSNGRSYNGRKMWGVSVFDFSLPSGRGKQKFVGYGCIPELTCA